jgi:NADH-quinone oxidoreductase subunit G
MVQQVTMHTEINLFWKTTVWMFGDEISVTGRKDEYHEVDEFICNGCRFDHKDIAD